MGSWFSFGSLQKAATKEYFSTYLQELRLFLAGTATVGGSRKLDGLGRIQLQWRWL